MKFRNITVPSLKEALLFCPSCHRQIDLPFKGEVKMQNALTLMCSNCKGGKIKVTIKDGDSI